MWAFSLIFKKLPKVNNRPRGENSPNLVTLSPTNLRLSANAFFDSLLLARRQSFEQVFEPTEKNRALLYIGGA
jgi:hypothetical protein